MASQPAQKKARTKHSRKSHPSPRDDPSETIVEASSSQSPTKNARYAEPPSLSIHSGVELGQDQAMDDLVERDVDGTLDENLAELSLGQRLTALTGQDADRRNTSPDDSDAEPSSARRKQAAAQNDVVPAHSLTRTLIQALHSSDVRLLETCLAHSDSTLIRNSVRRLPPQLAVPLLTACVERLGRGARATNMKGGGGGASSQRGMGLINWINAVLVVHSGHLMTMPDLVARLSGLHATLTSRLSLQESLLSLNGRLDMVLTQIEMRSSTAPASLPINGSKSKRTRGATRYIEGESEEDEEDEAMDAEVPVDDDEEGSVEEVELGGESDEDDDVEDESEDEDDDGDEPMVNGFIDDEAEEYSEDEDEEESE